MSRALLSLFALTVAGCIQTHLDTGLPPGDPPKGHEDRWHVSYFFGTVEGSGPYDLQRLCAHGWSEISVAPDFFTTVAGVATLYLYSPNRVTIVCARPIELDVPKPQPPPSVSASPVPGTTTP